MLAIHAPADIALITPARRDSPRPAAIVRSASGPRPNTSLLPSGIPTTRHEGVVTRAAGNVPRPGPIAPPPRCGFCVHSAGKSHGRNPMRPARQADPFSELGLPARPGLTDDAVRAAWRRIAAATHPDRADGGDAARFAAAAAAYTAIRTGFGRTEALADLARPAVRRWKAQVPGPRRHRPARAARREAAGPGPRR